MIVRFGSDVNVDGASTNDLLTTPRDGEVTVTGATYQDLVTFLEAGKCEGLTPGTTPVRNACRAPWTNTLDFHSGIAVPVGRFKPEFTADILNLLNLLNRNNGQVNYAAFNDLLVANSTFDAAGKYVYSVNTLARPGGVRYTRDDLRSRWQAQFGLRVRF